MPTAAATFATAHKLISGDRKASYGDYNREAAWLAKVWSGILKHEVEPRLVPLMMVALKLVRQSTGHKQDNLDDAAGYIGLAAEFEAAATSNQTS